jgi:adenine-specific DNA-methyltransferase
LLKDDGVIFVSIEDSELAQLRLLMDEVFGDENFVGQWNWFKSATPPNLSKKIKKNI